MSRCNLALDMKESTAKAGTIQGTTELVTDGDMEAVGTAAWSVTNGTMSKSTDNPHTGAQALRLDDWAGVDPYIQQVCMIVGKRYRARGWFRGDGTAYAQLHTGAAALADSTPSVSWQFFDVAFVAAFTSLFMMSRDGGAGNWVELDDLSVVETDELLDDADMEATGVAEWTNLLGTMSKETDTPYQGNQVFRSTETIGATFTGHAQAVLTIGRRYHVAVVARGDGTSNPYLSIDDAATNIWDGTPDAFWQSFAAEFTAESASITFGGNGMPLSGHVDFDHFSIRPVLSRTLDKSPNGHVCLLGDGFTANTIPDFLNPGFGLDGANQYLSLLQASGIYNNAAQSIVAVFRPGFNWNANINAYLYDSTNGSRYYVLKLNNASGNVLSISMGGTAIGSIASAVYSPYWIQNGINVLAVVSVSGYTDVRLNNHLIMTADATAWSALDSTEIYLGSNFAVAPLFSGEYLGFYTWPEKLSPLQVADFTLSRGVLV